MLWRTEKAKSNCHAEKCAVTTAPTEAAVLIGTLIKKTATEGSIAHGMIDISILKNAKGAYLTNKSKVYEQVLARILYLQQKERNLSYGS